MPDDSLLTPSELADLNFKRSEALKEYAGRGKAQLQIIVDKANKDISDWTAAINQLNTQIAAVAAARDQAQLSIDAIDKTLADAVTSLGGTP